MISSSAFGNAHSDLPSHFCYLNGDYTPLNEAKVSVLDRGFIFGDGIYEVLSVYGGKVFRFAQHMERLERSLKECRMRNPHTRQEWFDIAMKLIAAYAHSAALSSQNSTQNTLKSSLSITSTEAPANHLIYLQITRGVALREHVMPENITPTAFAMCNLLPAPSAAQRSQGVACVTADDFRWDKAHIKSTSLLGSVFARQISFDAGANETVMFRDGFLSEAAHSNVWVVKNGEVLGTPKDNLVLEGIRYGLIEDICRQSGISFTLRRLSREEVITCDELILSSATKEVLPVTTLDGAPVGSGQPGAIYQKLYAGYQAEKQQQRHD